MDQMETSHCGDEVHSTGVQFNRYRVCIQRIKVMGVTMSSLAISSTTAGIQFNHEIYIW